MKVLPFVIRIVLDTQCFSLTIGIYQRNWKRVTFWVDTSVVAESKRPVNSRLGDGPPEIDNLEPTPQKGWCIGGGKMAMDASNG